MFKIDEAEHRNIEVNRGNANLNAIRLACSFVMHLYCYPEIRLAQQMTQFALYNSHRFPERRLFFPLLLASMKMFGAVSAELGNIYYISGYQTITDVITGYVRMSIVTKMDDIMSLTLTTIDILGEYKNDPIVYTRRQNILTDYDLVKCWYNYDHHSSLFQWISSLTFLLCNRIINFVYVVVYYYFLPFLIIVGVELY